MDIQSDNQTILTDELAAADTSAAPDQAVKRPPFIYAKRNGVLVMEVANGHAKAVCRPNVNTPALTEVRRFMGMPLELEIIAPDKFDAMLQHSYEYGSSQTMQMMGDMGEEMDLSSIAQQLPEPEDLQLLRDTRQIHFLTHITHHLHGL